MVNIVQLVRDVTLSAVCEERADAEYDFPNAEDSKDEPPTVVESSNVAPREGSIAIH